MGIFSSIKKAYKKALKFVHKVTGFTGLVKGVKGIWDNLTGKTAAKNMAQAQEAQLRQQSEQAKLDAANEVGNVTQFSDGESIGLGADTQRRKKRSAGSYGSGIGLVV